MFLAHHRVFASKSSQGWFSFYVEQSERKFVFAHGLGCKVKVISSASSSKRVIRLLFGQVTLAQVLCFKLLLVWFGQVLAQPPVGKIGAFSLAKVLAQVRYRVKSISYGMVKLRLKLSFFFAIKSVCVSVSSLVGSESLKISALAK